MDSNPKRLNLDDPQVFNKWRELYDELTDEEQITFANECEDRFPSQQHFTPSNFEDFFEDIEEERLAKEIELNGDQTDDDKAKFKIRTKVIGPSVLEVGGWKGELAQLILSKYPMLGDWHNIDICQQAVTKTSCNDHRFSNHVPSQFRWFERKREGKYQVCVVSHSIEHFSDKDFIGLATFIAGIPTVIFEAPIKLEHDDWSDYLGTHILRMGWLGVAEVMGGLGYKSQKINDSCMVFQK